MLNVLLYLHEPSNPAILYVPAARPVGVYVFDESEVTVGVFGAAAGVTVNTLVGTPEFTGYILIVAEPLVAPGHIVPW